MKTWVSMAVAMAIAFTCGMAMVSAQDKPAPAEGPKPEKKMIVGEAVSLATYAMEGKLGAEMAEAMKYEAEKGFPVGIVEDETGAVYIAVYRDNAPASHLEAANKHMVDLVGKKVSAQGLVYSMPNLNVIRISLISEY
jgi:hypothetical protein